MVQKAKGFVCFIISIFILSFPIFNVSARSGIKDDTLTDTVFKQNGITWWNPYEQLHSRGECPDGYIPVDSTSYNGDTSTSQTLPQGDDAASVIIGYLMNNGYSKTAAAAFAGNFMVESGLNPRKLQGGKIVPENFIAYANGAKTYSEGGFGLAQWTTAGRVKNLQDYANSHNLGVATMSAQLGFVIVEATGAYNSSVGPGRINSMSLEEATFQVRRYYEGPGAMIWTTHNGTYYNDYVPGSLSEVNKDRTPGAYREYSKALQAAQSLLGITPSTNLPDDANSNSIICVRDPNSTTGDDEAGGGESIDGYIFYSQCDPAWGKLKYGKDGVGGPAGNAICTSGCGPTSFAVIATNLLHRSITPKDTADVAGRAGMHSYSEKNGWEGSSHDITKVLGKHYDLKVIQISKSISEINSYLEKGYMIHTSGTGSPPFTANGHYIAIVAKLSDGRWLVGDSSKNGPSGKYNPSTVIAGMNASVVYAVGV